MLSAEVEGPQQSSAGRAATKSAIEVGAILIMIEYYALGKYSKKSKRKRGWLVELSMWRLIEGSFLCREAVAVCTRAPHLGSTATSAHIDGHPFWLRLHFAGEQAILFMPLFTRKWP
jgi:hypothetical protein